ncbi:MAG: bifunctional folylpolyglutamate synthase/dihydrofolate synthase [Clostridia bacterium]
MSVTGFETYQEAFEWIRGLSRFGQKPGLERVRWMLSRLDHPERRLAFIHVAGTNGKGSTCAYLNRILRQAGYSTGLFTSPFLVDFREWIRANDEMIGMEDFRMLVNELKPLAEACAKETPFGEPTEFEVITVLAIQYFARIVCPSVVIWETGLGGRLDSTNVVHPIVSVITNIGLDHTDILGATIEEIAAEKAGIIKPGVPVITCEDSPQALDVLEEAARRNRSTLYRLNRDFFVEQMEERLGQQKLSYKSKLRRDVSEYSLSLNGLHQPLNASAALATIDVLRNFYAFLVEEEEISQGLQLTRWPGRLEVVSQEPLIVLDGAHNAEGMQVLANSLQKLLSGEQQVDMLIASVADKPLAQMAQAAKPLVNRVRQVTLTTFDMPRAASAEKLADAYLTAGIEQEKLATADDWHQFLRDWKKQAAPTDCLIVCGSLYFIAQVRPLLYNVEEAGE